MSEFLSIVDVALSLVAILVGYPVYAVYLLVFALYWEIQSFREEMKNERN